ncbi:MAG TPA: electron transfer flavoprotein-ubiquinone oxidoreductase [Gammaproteobacteria bacterium]|nr:electron transfer flavoprotein-ubiquinone oxidoreductase [Gammaproteobacteria bacterium]
MQREVLEFDVAIVGAGPAGLSAACRLGQLAAAKGIEPSVCVLEKGAEVGAHILSGAVLEPRALDELFPDWRERGAPVRVGVGSEAVHWLASANRSLRLPGALVPATMRNDGNYVVSLGRLCQWLAAEAEALGVSVFPGFPATEVLYDEQGRVAGVVTGDRGIGADGAHKPGYTPGIELRAREVVFAEGCRDSLGKVLEQRLDLRADRDPQHYGIGLKEIWTIPGQRHAPGTVVHTFGWPLDNHTEGGGFLYHADDRQVYLGIVVALSYRNPYLSPFEELQRWKQHPLIRQVIEGGERIAYGARALNKGGWQSVPRLSFPGGLLVGCEAGLLNGAKIKGIHTAMKSGLVAAEALFATLYEGREVDYERALAQCWAGVELTRARNYSAGMARFGTWLGGSLAFLEHSLLRGRVPYTLRSPTPDHATLERAASAQPIEYPPPDGVVSFDRLSSVYLSNTSHEEDQPKHLRLRDPQLPIRENLPLYDEPAQRYCPAAVYEVVTAAGSGPHFQINAQNCVHCKTCDIKDPAQNITWVPPEGGGGPNYSGM